MPGLHPSVTETRMPERKYRIAVIPGDGIGQEVIPEGQRAAEAVAGRHGFAIEWQLFDWSCQRYAETGRMMPEDGIAQVKEFDAIYLGAVGFPGVPDHVSLWGLLIPLRRELDLYANVRPVRLLKGMTSRSEEHTSELQSLMRISYAVFCLKK